MKQQTFGVTHRMFRSTGQASRGICPRTHGMCLATCLVWQSLLRIVVAKKAVDVGLVESVTMNLNAAIDMGMKNVAQQRIVRDMQQLGWQGRFP